MKKFFLVLIFLLAASTAYANCAIEKKGEFDKINDELKKLDRDLYLEAQRAFGIISAFEAFDDKSPKCSHIDSLLESMKDTIDTLTP